MNLTVLHIFSGPLSGGAARGAISLHEALRELNIDSRVLTSSDGPLAGGKVRSASWTGFSGFESKARGKLEKICLNAGYPNRLRTTFSVSCLGAPVSQHTWVRKADLIHLHWINGAFVRIEDVARIGKPIVWTMRDMWPFTGGCHYSLDCEKFTGACGACPQLRSSKLTDVSRRQVQRKKSVYRRSNITFVGTSPWVSRMAARSGVLPENSRIVTILNAVRTESFRSFEREYSRRKHGIPLNEPVVLLGAASIFSPYKGFKEAKEALSILGDTVYVAVFGKGSESAAAELPRAKGFGSFTDDRLLSELYSAADIFLAPSIADAAPKTVMEAMLCGSTVVAFNATGLADLIEHKTTGYLARPYNSEDLATGIQWLLTDNRRREVLAANAREKVLKEFSYSVIAPKYEALYREILGK